MKTLTEYIQKKQINNKHYGNINTNLNKINDIKAGDYFEIHEIMNGKEVSCLYGKATAAISDGGLVPYDFLVDIENRVKVFGSMWVGSNYNRHICMSPTEEHIAVLNEIAKYIEEYNIKTTGKTLKIGDVRNNKFIPQ